MRQDSVGADPQVSEEGTHVTGSPTSRPNWNMPPERNLFSAKRINHCNDFVARVALEVVDSAWWKHQLRVKSAGSGTTAFSLNEGASRRPLFAFAYFLCQPGLP